MAGGGLEVYGGDFVARGHALAGLGGLEVECVLEDLDFVLNLAAVGRLVDGLLYVVVNLLDGEFPGIGGFLVYSEQAHESAGQGAGQPGDGIEYPVYQPKGECDEAHCEVGVDAENGLGEEFAGDEDDEGGDEGIANEQECLGAGEPFLQYGVENYGDGDAVDDKGDVVADQQRGNEHVGAVREALEDAGDESAACGVNLDAYFVGLYECDLGSGEESGEEYCDDGDGYCGGEVHKYIIT